MVIIATFKLGKKYVKKTVVPLTQPTVLVSVQSGKIVAFCCYTLVPYIFLQLQCLVQIDCTVAKAAKGMGAGIVCHAVSQGTIKCSKDTIKNNIVLLLHCQQPCDGQRRSGVGNQPKLQQQQALLHLIQKSFYVAAVSKTSNLTVEYLCLFTILVCLGQAAETELCSFGKGQDGSKTCKGICSVSASVSSTAKALIFPEGRYYSNTLLTQLDEFCKLIP